MFYLFSASYNPRIAMDRKKYCHFLPGLPGVIATFYPVRPLFTRCYYHFLPGIIATGYEKSGFYIDFMKNLIYNTTGGINNGKL